MPDKIHRNMIPPILCTLNNIGFAPSVAQLISQNEWWSKAK